jgi:hypothetical protein
MLAPLLLTAYFLGVSPDAPLAAPREAPELPLSALTQLPAPVPPPRDRAQRIAIELLVAGSTGAGVGVLGGYFGCLGSASASGQTCSTSTIAAAGLTSFGLTVAAVVPLAGNAVGGDGLLYAAWIGEAAGLGAGLALAQGNPRNAMYFAAPLMLVGAVAGYELTAGWGGTRPPLTTGVQAVAVQPANSGAVLAVAGRF